MPNLLTLTKRLIFATPTYCYCSLGWMKETFDTVLGKPVEVALIDSIKRGAQTCRFTISQIAPAGSQSSDLNSEG